MRRASPIPSAIEGLLSDLLDPDLFDPLAAADYFWPRSDPSLEPEPAIRCEAMSATIFLPSPDWFDLRSTFDPSPADLFEGDLLISPLLPPLSDPAAPPDF